MADTCSSLELVANDMTNRVVEAGTGHNGVEDYNPLSECGNDVGVSDCADTDKPPKRPPRSERKRLRHEALLLRRREERKKKKLERKTRLREQKDEDNTDEQQSKRELKETRRKRCLQAMLDGQKICIDCSMEHYMSQKEQGKLAMQIGRLYGSNLKAESHVHIYLTGLNKGGQLYRECVNKLDGFENYLIDRKEESTAELFPLDSIVYLSPDSENTLSDIDPEKVYVIGGLVDENIKQSLTKARAAEMQVATARLPLEEHMVHQAANSHVLAVNQVFDILLTYIATKDWKKALAAGVPRRKGYIVQHDGNIVQHDGNN